MRLILKIEAQGSVELVAGGGISDSATPACFYGGAVEAGVSAGVEDLDVGRASCCVDGDSQHHEALLSRIAGFHRVGRRGLYDVGGFADELATGSLWRSFGQSPRRRGIRDSFFC